MKQSKRYKKEVFQALSMITQFGINMLVPIGGMTWLGMYLDKRWGTSYLVIFLFFAGAFAGGRNVYHMAKKIYGEKEQGNQNYGRKKDK